MSSSASPDEQAAKRAKTSESVEASKVLFCLQTLEGEVEDLRSSLPEYVTDLGCLELSTLVVDRDGTAVRPEEEVDGEDEGPWDLNASVAGSKDSPYEGPWRVRLQFHKDLWPTSLAVVRFQCVFRHAFVDDDGGMMTPFYKHLTRDSRKVVTLRSLLADVHRFLVDPWASWGIPSPAERGSRVSEALDEYKKSTQTRMDVIKAYAAQRRHAELFLAGPCLQEQLFAIQHGDVESNSKAGSWLAPGFLVARSRARAAATEASRGLQGRQAAAAARVASERAWRESGLLREELAGEVYSFPIFTEAFCDMLVDELMGFYASKLPARRPNSMNAYGVILNDIGLEPLMDELQAALQPLGDALWPGPGSAWDGHHCFAVRYRAGEDLGLDMHTDDSDVTFNICLGIDFTGAGLQFCGHMGAPDHRKHSYTYRHVKGSCVCHLGRKRHGADDITSGERLNLIIWNRSSTYRTSNEYLKPGYFKESGPPDKVCVSYTHDRDFGRFREYPKGTEERFRGRGWCPRRSFEYPGFVAEEGDGARSPERCDCPKCRALERK
eukprot:TRINITY_DN40142_c0_g1_i1.p1 TRINITY_DN40142_c0_g1~~TRINITY_DN40142_c0_g1_i1.p1  ORF type:complete len:552 (+),score=98.68 TRINITY_DN40142_c0_g1_i1:20-1675(+)